MIPRREQALRLLDEFPKTLKEIRQALRISAGYCFLLLQELQDAGEVARSGTPGKYVYEVHPRLYDEEGNLSLPLDAPELRKICARVIEQTRRSTEPAETFAPALLGRLIREKLGRG